MHKVVLDGTSYNMASLVRLGKYGTINIANPIKMGYDVITFVYQPLILQEDQNTGGKISKGGEI